MSSLLPYEIRHLQHRLRRERFLCDFVPRLPIDIHLCIVDFLGLRDVVNASRVSKEWRKTWLQVNICDKLMRQHFRTEYEAHYTRELDEMKQSIFLRTSERHCSFRQGRYQAMTMVPYAEILDSMGVRPARNQQYCNGRVAWGIKSGVCVYDLHTGTTHSYMTPQRDKPSYWVLTDALVVAVPSNDKSVFCSSPNLLSSPRTKRKRSGTDKIQDKTLCLGASGRELQYDAFAVRSLQPYFGARG